MQMISICVMTLGRSCRTKYTACPQSGSSGSRSRPLPCLVAGAGVAKARQDPAEASRRRRHSPQPRSSAISSSPTRNLSASGQQVCSTCHVPTHAYTAVDGLAVPLGGPGMNLPGLRNAQFEYNDLPLRFDANVNIGEVPYTPPKIGGGRAPTLSADDITAVIAFLCTLTDGYDPAHPRTYALPAQCAATSTSSSQHSSAD